MTTILVVAPTALARASLAGLLAARKTFHVLVAPLGPPLAGLMPDSEPDVLLIDLGSERADEALREVAGLPRPPAVVVLAEDLRGALTADVFRAGVRAVLPRHATAEEIIAAVDAAMAGLVALHPDALPALRPGPATHQGAAPGAAAQSLTPRETEVLGMMAEGLGNKIIATRLGISEHTVKFHAAAIFAKLGAESRTEAVTIGVRQGLIMI